MSSIKRVYKRDFLLSMRPEPNVNDQIKTVFYSFVPASHLNEDYNYINLLECIVVSLQSVEHSRITDKVIDELERKIKDKGLSLDDCTKYLASMDKSDIFNKDTNVNSYIKVRDDTCGKFEPYLNYFLLCKHLW